MKVAFLTLGCKVNSYETEKMKQQFEKAGCQIASFHELADVYIVNTCTVTNIADRKSRKMLHRARRLNPDAVVVAAGCYVDSALQKGEKDESIDIFLKNEEKDSIVQIVETAFRDREGKSGEERNGTQQESLAGMSDEARKEMHTRAYLKVQNGCNQFCTYCIIPYVRGPLTSRPIQNVLQEVKQLATNGYQEVVVTGIHLSSYGIDFSVGTDVKINADSFLALDGKPLLELLAAVSRVEGIERIRMGSLEPRIITEEFVRELSEIPKICPHFHLSLQSGCDETLKRMNRHYTTQEYLDRLAILRKYFVHPAITTDIIVGFPQETEEEFHTTCRFARDAAFAQIHVFKYSRRQGTIADTMEGQVPEPVKAERSDRLLAIEAELEANYQAAFQGEEEVLLEEVTEIDGYKYLTGYNERYVRIGIKLEDEAEAFSRCNTIATVRILGHITPEILLADWK